MGKPKKTLSAAEKAPVEKAAKKPKHVMAPGKAVTSKRGILGDGDAVTPDLLAGGKKAFDKFLKSGHIKVNK